MPPTGEGVVIDIGTGDGLFVYECARANPNKFYIGIDANPRPLEKVSEKIHRNPAKRGLPNVLLNGLRYRLRGRSAFEATKRER